LRGRGRFGRGRMGGKRVGGQVLDKEGLVNPQENIGIS